MKPPWTRVEQRSKTKNSPSFDSIKAGITESFTEVVLLRNAADMSPDGAQLVAAVRLGSGSGCKSGLVDGPPGSDWWMLR